MISRGADGRVRWLEVDAKQQESKPKNIFKATLLAALQGARGSAGEYQADDQAGIAQTSWRLSVR